MFHSSGLVLNVEVYMTRIMTVIWKASPQPIPASLSRLLSIRILFEYSGDELRTVEVISSIIAVTANHRLMSEEVKGKLKFMLITTGGF